MTLASLKHAGRRLAPTLAARRPPPQTQQIQSSGSQALAAVDNLAFTTCILSLLSGVAPYSAVAEEALSYNPSGGEGMIQNVSGAAYIVLVAYFLYRVLTRRAKRATEEKIAGQGGPSLKEKLFPGKGVTRGPVSLAMAAPAHSCLLQRFKALFPCHCYICT